MPKKYNLEPKHPPARTGDPLVELCRGLPSATEDVKWGNDLIFSVGDKMFAGFPLPDGERFSFTVDSEVYHDLIGHNGIVPAPYLARHNWVNVTDRGLISLATLKDFLEESHRLVGAKLPKRKRQALGLDAAGSESKRGG